MSNLFLILVIAFIFIVFVIALLAIGWLIKGKTKVQTPSSSESVSSSSFSPDDQKNESSISKNLENQ